MGNILKKALVTLARHKKKKASGGGGDGELDLVAAIFFDGDEEINFDDFDFGNITDSNTTDYNMTSDYIFGEDTMTATPVDEDEQFFRDILWKDTESAHAEFERLKTLDAYLIIGPMILTIFCMMFLIRRKNLCPNCLNGRFALLVPVNFLEGRSRRKAFVAAFALCTMNIIDMLGIKSPEVSPYFKIFIKLGYMSLVSLRLLPIFSAIYMATLPTSILGLIYLLIAIGLDILKEIPETYVSPGELFKELFLQVTVLIIAGNYLIYWFVLEIFNACGRRKVETEGSPSFGSKNQMKYVKHLLIPARFYLMDKVNLQIQRSNKFITFFRKYVYNNVSDPSLSVGLFGFKGILTICLLEPLRSMYPMGNSAGSIYTIIILHLFLFVRLGFRYSLTILVSCTIGFLGITNICTSKVYDFVSDLLDCLHVLDRMHEWKESKIPNIVAVVIHFATKNRDRTVEATPIAIYDFVYTQSLIILVGSLLAGLVAYILGVLTILHVLKSYRENVINLAKRKEDQGIIILKKYSNVSLVRSAIQYGGYQVAYFIAGFTIQLLGLMFLFIMVGEIIVVPIQFAFWSFLKKMSEIIVPVITALILIYASQWLLIKFCFLQDRGKTLALDNRRGYFLMSYFVFFYNIFAGVFSCAKRIFKGVIIGIILVPRLDKCAFPKTFEKRDSGFKAYSCLLHMEALQANPVVRSFVALLLKRRCPRIFNDCKNHYEHNTLLHPAIPRRKQVAQNRWFVAYTMLRNPSIISCRGNLNMLSILEAYSKPLPSEKETNV